MCRLTLVCTLVWCALLAAADTKLESVRVAKDGKGFVLEPSGQKFIPWGFNYDHDAKGRLIEDYWADEWTAIEGDFAEMKRLGANVVRVHLQFGKFMDAADKPNAKALDRLGELLKLAEKERLYLDLTGLGCYHKADVPAWYDKLSESDRWAAQARFWEVVAGRCKESPAVFCYDLMNEPVVPGGKRKAGEWLGPAVRGQALRSVHYPRPGRSQAAGHCPRMGEDARDRDPQGGQEPPNYGRPGRLEPGPAGADVRVRARRSSSTTSISCASTCTRRPARWTRRSRR